MKKKKQGRKKSVYYGDWNGTKSKTILEKLKIKKKKKRYKTHVILTDRKYVLNKLRPMKYTEDLWARYFFE